MEKRFCPKCKSTDVEKIIDILLTAGAPKSGNVITADFITLNSQLKKIKI